MRDLEKRRAYDKKWREENREKRNAYNREWRKKNPEKAKGHHTKWRENNIDKVKAYRTQYNKENRAYRLDYKLLKTYGLAKGVYETMLKQQLGACAICGINSPGGNGRFHVDHNHVTKKVRELLCLNCNNGIGKFKDDLSLLEKAVVYLRKHL